MTAPYSVFDTALAARERLSPSFVRITLAGPRLADCSPVLLDQRVKLLIGPDAALGPLVGAGDRWYEAFVGARDPRPALRTYTLSAVRPGCADVRPGCADVGAAGEVDIDVAVHPLNGRVEPAVRGAATKPERAADSPGLRFALEAPLGSRALLVAGDRRRAGHDTVGLAWRPDAAADILLVGDETALPAIANIVAALPAEAIGRVICEVPGPADLRDLGEPDGVRVTWRVRSAGERASGVFAGRWAGAGGGEATREAADEGEVLWDEASASHGRQGWVAGEATWVRSLRAEARAAGVPRGQVSFMGYWRRGVAGS